MKKGFSEKRNLRRFFLFSIFTAFVILLILWKYFTVMILERPDKIPFEESVYAAERGPIFDRNGRVLAIQTRLYTVSAWIPNIIDRNETALLLGRILDIDPDNLLDDFDSKRGYMFIKRKISPTESDRIQQHLDEGKLKGISLEPEYGRSYPEKAIGSHLLGYVGTDNTGLNGIEYTFDDVLAPKSTSKESYGNQIYLTIDLNIQYMAEKLAREAFETYNPDSVMILAMDSRNGNMLAWVSIPEFDPNTFYSFSESERMNRPLSMAYEPGSVFKIFSLASLLETGSVTEESSFFCDGAYEHPSFPESINCLGVHHWVNPRLIIKYSCNSGAAAASESISNQGMYDMLKSFGFGTQTQLPIPGESSGLFRSPDRWSARSKPTISIGQEVSVSAIQMVTAATALANKGQLLKPHIIDRVITQEGKIIKEYEREALREVLSPRVASSILEMMTASVETGGTAHRAKIEGIRMSAKTGTAQIIDPATNSYSHDAFLASCLSIFPTDNPQIILYVVIEHPRGEEIYGGRIAAPIVKDLGEQIITYLGIPTENERVLEHSGKIFITKKQPLRLGEILPDFTGMPKRDLLPLFQDPRIHLSITGEGWVIRQNPGPGTKITEGMTIELELE